MMMIDRGSEEEEEDHPSVTVTNKTNPSYFLSLSFEREEQNKTFSLAMKRTRTMNVSSGLPTKEMFDKVYGVKNEPLVDILDNSNSNIPVVEEGDINTEEMQQEEVVLDCPVGATVRISVAGNLCWIQKDKILNSFPDSRLALYVAKQLELGDSKTRTIFIDTDPVVFRYILQILRRPSLLGRFTPPDVPLAIWIADLEYYGLLSPGSQMIEDEPTILSPPEYKFFTDMNGSTVGPSDRPQKKPRLLVADEFRKEQLKKDTVCVDALVKLLPMHKAIERGANGGTIHIPLHVEIDGLDLAAYMKLAKDRVYQLMKELTGITISDFVFTSNLKRDSVEYMYRGVKYDTFVTTSYSLSYSFR